ncbi:hypothetical protein IL306_007297 [Fusarium sp. DS 682]|nr:hypothetical protein IL306_007297 [Fusarium sp. DS 682]
MPDIKRLSPAPIRRTPQALKDGRDTRPPIRPNIYVWPPQASTSLDSKPPAADRRREPFIQGTEARPSGVSTTKIGETPELPRTRRANVPIPPDAPPRGTRGSSPPINFQTSVPQRASNESSGLQEKYRTSNPRLGMSSNHSSLGRRKQGAQSPSKSNVTSDTTTTKSTGPYDRAFQQHLIDHDIYPDSTLVRGNPDLYYGARPEQLDQKVRQELGSHIIPSTQHDLPIVPNFFLEVKGPDGSAAVAKR